MMISEAFLILLIIRSGKGSNFAKLLDSAPCDKPTIKSILHSCILECLNLKGSNESCKFDSYAGTAIERSSSSCTECIPLNPTSPLAMQVKAMHNLGSPSIKTMCGKKILYANTMPLTPEHVQYSCNIVDVHKRRSWKPQSMKEIKCVLENLPDDYQSVGKLIFGAFKSNCRKAWRYCDGDWLRPFPASLSVNQSSVAINQGSQNGTCAMIKFKISKKVATSIELLEMGCDDKAPIVCEIV